MRAHTGSTVAGPLPARSHQTTIEPTRAAGAFGSDSDAHWRLTISSCHQHRRICVPRNSRPELLSCWSQFFESYNKLLTTGLPSGYRGYMSRSAQGIGMDLTLVGALRQHGAWQMLR